MKKVLLVTTTMIFSIVSMATPAFADSQASVSDQAAIAQAQQTVSSADQTVKTDQATYDALVAKAQQVSSSGTIPSPAQQTLSQALDPALQALKQATTSTQVTKALNQIERIVERIKEQMKSGKKVLSSEQLQSLKKFVDQVHRDKSIVTSDIVALGGGTIASKQGVRRLEKDTSKLVRAVAKMGQKFKKWENIIEQRLPTQGSTSNTGTTTSPVPLAPPAPPAAP